MEKNIKEIVYTEYGLELLECFINELSQYEGLKMVTEIIRPPLKLLTNDFNKEKAAFLAAESDIIKYNTERERLEMPLTENKEKIKKMLDSKRILALLKEE